MKLHLAALAASILLLASGACARGGFFPTDVFDVTIKSPSVDISFQAPLSSNTAPKINVAGSWVHSHDRVLWEKGIYDDVYYNGGLSDAQLIPVDADDVVWTHLGLISSVIILLRFFTSTLTFISSAVPGKISKKSTLRRLDLRRFSCVEDASLLLM